MDSNGPWGRNERMRKVARRGLPALALLGAVALLGAGCASGKGAERRQESQRPAQLQQRTIMGEVTEVSPLLKNVTIRDQESNQELTLEIKDQSQILQDGSQVELNELTEGVPVRASYAITADGPVATKVEIIGEPQPQQQEGGQEPRTEAGQEGDQAQGEQPQGEQQQLSGKVADVSPFFNDLKVETEEGREVTLEVSDETRIMLDGNEVELGAIPEGSEVRASYNIRPDGGFIADTIEITAPGVLEGGDERQMNEGMEQPRDDNQEQNFEPLARAEIGIGGRRFVRLLPCHTTGHAGPHPAVRLVEVHVPSLGIPSRSK